VRDEKVANSETRGKRSSRTIDANNRRQLTASGRRSNQPLQPSAYADLLTMSRRGETRSRLRILSNRRRRCRPEMSPVGSVNWGSRSHAWPTCDVFFCSSESSYRDNCYC